MLVLSAPCSNDHQCMTGEHCELVALLDLPSVLTPRFALAGRLRCQSHTLILKGTHTRTHSRMHTRACTKHALLMTTGLICILLTLPFNRTCSYTAPTVAASRPVADCVKVNGRSS